MSSPRFLVVGSTGTVGAEVVRALVDRGAGVRTLVRAPGRARTSDGVEAVAGDLSDAPSLAHALDGVDGAFFVTPHGPGEAALGHAFVAACAAARAGLLRAPIARTRPTGSATRSCGWPPASSAPTTAASSRSRRRRRCSDAVVLMPTNFFQNDTMFLREIAGGSYPHPLGARGVNRVDCGDIGDAAARALLDDGVAPGLYPIVGPAAWTGEACAAVWSAALGRPVQYAGDDVAAWRRLVSDRIAAPKRDDFAKTYRILQRWRSDNAPALAATTALLGRAPRTFESWVAAESARMLMPLTPRRAFSTLR